MSLFFPIQSLQLLIFCKDGKELVTNLDYAPLCFRLQSLSNHLLNLCLFYMHVSIEPIDCIHLSSSEFRAILIIFSVKILCLSLLNLCSIFNIDLLFFFCFFFCLIPDDFL